MSALAKGALGGLALLSISSAVAVKASKTANWNKNHPVATAWLEENNYSLKNSNKFTDFDNGSKDTHFGLGCHRYLFGGKNFRKIYDENKIAAPTPTPSVQSTDSLPDKSFFGDPKEPLFGCSTAAKSRNNNIYDFELALRQGDKGFEERISVHTDKIISQLVFLEKNTDPATKTQDPYKPTFSLYRYIKQNHKNGEQNIYKWAKPTSTGNESVWRDLDLSTGSKEETARYYAVWVNGKGGKNIFDSLGVKSNEKLFSSIVKSDHLVPNEGFVSDFVFVDKDHSSSNNSLLSEPLKHYKLSILDSLIRDISKRKGHWTSASSLCSSANSLKDERIEIGELKQLAQYCYQPKPKQ